MGEFYEERDFDGEVYFRLVPGGAYFKKRTIYNKGDPPIERILKYLKHHLGVKGTVELLDILNVSACVICRIRKGHKQISPHLFMRMHDASGLSINELRAIGGLEQVTPYARKTPQPQPKE